MCEADPYISSLLAIQGMQKDLISKLERFYDLTETEQQDILKSIVISANSDPEKFRKGIHNEPFNQLNYLPIVYEALSTDLDNWSDFFLVEIDRLLKAAKNSKHPNTILNHLQEFAFINPKNFKHRQELVDILKRELDNDHPTFRYHAITLLADFIKDDDYQTINKLKHHLSDPNWKIRYWTYQNLKDLNKLGNHDKLSLTDKVRAKLLNTLDFE